MSEPTKAPAASAGSRAATKKELPEHFKAYKHVWVFIEQERGQVHPVSWELMGAGRKLADKLKVELAAVVLGRTTRRRSTPPPKPSAMAPTSPMWWPIPCSPTIATRPIPRPSPMW